MRNTIITILLLISFSVPETNSVSIQNHDSTEINSTQMNDTINITPLNDSIECDNCQADQIEDDYSFFYIGLILGVLFIVIRKRKMKL